jgi:hypothetical protein
MKKKKNCSINGEFLFWNLSFNQFIISKKNYSLEMNIKFIAY